MRMEIKIQGRKNQKSKISPMSPDLRKRNPRFLGGDLQINLQRQGFEEKVNGGSFLPCRENSTYSGNQFFARRPATTGEGPKKCRGDQSSAGFGQGRSAPEPNEIWTVRLMEPSALSRLACFCGWPVLRGKPTKLSVAASTGMRTLPWERIKIARGANGCLRLCYR